MDGGKKGGSGKGVRALGTILLVLSLAIELAWIFLAEPYSLFSIVSIVLFLALLVLALVRPAYFTLLDSDGRKWKRKCSVFMPAFFAANGLAFRSLVDFNILNESALWIAAGVFLLALTLVMYFHYRNIKRKSGQAVLLFALLMMFSYGFAVQGNYLFDFREPDAAYTEILKKSISKGVRGWPDSYCLTVFVDGRERALVVHPDLYDTVEIGDDVIVAVHSGAFGIHCVHYSDVWGVDEWEAYQTEIN